MKKLLLLLALLISIAGFSQNFERNWRQVYVLEREGKVKLASVEVSKIYKKAKKNGDASEIVRTFLYQSKFAHVLEEDAQYKIIKNLRTEMATQDLPTQALFYYLYSSFLNDYLTLYRYKINRTALKDSSENPDFRTWSSQTFAKEIEKASYKSVENEAILASTPLKKFEKIIDFAENDKNLNRSLYDFLVEKHIEKIKFYGSLSKNEKQFFSQNKEALYGETEIFSKLILPSSATKNVLAKLRYFQKLEAYYLKNNDLNSLSSVVLKRLTYLYDHDLNSEEIVGALKAQSAKFPPKVNTPFLLKLASVYISKSSKNPNYNKFAMEICDTIIQRNEANSILHAQAIKTSLLQKHIKVTSEKFVLPNQPNKALLNFKNVDTLFGSLYKVPAEFEVEATNSDYYYKKSNDSLYLDYANNRKPYKNFELILPNQNDYNSHSTEVILPSLEAGNYIVFFKITNGPVSKNDIYSYATIKSTALQLYTKTLQTADEFQVVHRKTGEPLKEVILKFKDAFITTNQDGFGRFDTRNDSQILKIIHGNDTLAHYFRKDNYSREYKQKGGKKVGRVSIFTDRAIYRPGQNVFFKGILTAANDDESRVASDVYLNVVAEDGKGQEFYKKRIKTNEFGSISGEFSLPKNAMNGQFKLSFEKDDEFENDKLYDKKSKKHPFWNDIKYLEYNALYFRVEEYKRPNFEVVFEPIKENFVLNQQLTVKGKAVSFNGALVSNAKVTYVIYQYGTYDKTWENFPTEGDDDTLITGEAETDAHGNFEIKIMAVADKEVVASNRPVIYYNIEATVTDINGETQKNSSTVKAGFHTVAVSMSVDNEIFSNHPQEILVNSTNLNNQFTPVKGELKIYKLKSPTRVLKFRNWETPDIQAIPKEIHQKLFPFDAYDEPQQIRNREDSALVLVKKIDTNDSKNIAFPDLKNWEAGNYKIYFTAKDNFKNEIETTSFFNLIKESDKKTADNELFQFSVLNKNPEADGFALVKMAAGVPKLYVFTEATYQNESLFKKIIALDNGSEIFKVPVKKNAVGPVTIRAFITWENRNYQEEIIINLVEEEKKNIEVQSFRSKLEPGQNETWSFSINNKKNKKEPSEILASMYDSSLDKINEEKWNSDLFYVNDDHPYLRSASPSYNQNNFNFSNFPVLDKIFTNPKTEMNWFGFDFLNSKVNQYAYSLYVLQKVSNAESGIISGRVTDISGPVPGASVHITGTNTKTQTDTEGFYFIKGKMGDTINISFVGYDDYAAPISNYVTNVELSYDITIGQVVITGNIGIKRKSHAVTSSYLATPQTITGTVAGLSPQSSDRVVFRGARSTQSDNKPLVVIDGRIASVENLEQLAATDLYDITTLRGAQGAALYGSEGVNGVIVVTTKRAVAELGNVKTRKNFNETAFFYPQIRTDKSGNFSFNFTTPEALTQWKLRLLAHDKKANSAYLEKLVVTQKELMVTPNLPRFLREKDSITITTKISNLTPEAKSGLAMLQLFDAVSMEPVDAKMLNINSAKSFKIDAAGNTSVSWKIFIPEGLQGVQYKIVAKAGNYSDGEENILPVLTNNILVTESIPVWVRENSSKEYTFESLKNNTSTTLRNQQLTFEYTSNPTWLAIQALPYLMEFEHECAEQTFARYYANALASEIVNSNPKIAAVFESWKKSEKPISKLQQNEELKSVLLAETPWIMDAQSEEEKKKNLATLFDMQKMKDSQKAILEKLAKKQKSSGGFAWFDDGNESEYITRHIISGLGHLQKLSKNATGDFDEMTKNGVGFLDQKFFERHKISETARTSQKLIWNYPYDNLHYLYARSFYLEKYPLDEKSVSITKRYMSEIKENWLNYSLYEKGLASLVLNRFGEKETAKKILENLRQTSSYNEDWGMYWIENKSGWYWYQAPIETQALLIEAFAEIENDKKSVDAMKVWLLKNKQNKNWPTTKATTEAVYALLMQGNDWISVKDKTIIKLGDEKIMTKKLSENEKEAGTGYIKMNWNSDEISKEMATVSVKNTSEVPGFGGFYWQYLEDLDKIKSSQDSPMTIEKELFQKVATSEGHQLQKITNEKPLKIGNLVTVRLIILTKEDMDFVHLKDMRASCFEPIDVLSKYKWQNGLGYYQSTKDVATHFFFDKINKGKFVLEYDIRVNNLGDFSNGISTIQSIYAPEFSSHTKGIRVKIEE